MIDSEESSSDEPVAEPRERSSSVPETRNNADSFEDLDPITQWKRNLEEIRRFAYELERSAPGPSFQHTESIESVSDIELNFGTTPPPTYDWSECDNPYHRATMCEQRCEFITPPDRDDPMGTDVEWDLYSNPFIRASVSSATTPGDLELRNRRAMLNEPFSDFSDAEDVHRGPGWYRGQPGRESAGPIYYPTRVIEDLGFRANASRWIREKAAGVSNAFQQFWRTVRELFDRRPSEVPMRKQSDISHGRSSDTRSDNQRECFSPRGVPVATDALLDRDVDENLGRSDPNRGKPKISRSSSSAAIIKAFSRLRRRSKAKERAQIELSAIIGDKLANPDESSDKIAAARNFHNEEAAVGRSKAELSVAGPSRADILEAGPSRADFFEAGPSRADFFEAGPSRADFREAGSSRADFFEAGPSRADFREAGSSRADFFEAGPSRADFREAGPSRADFFEAGPLRVHLPEVEQSAAGIPEARPSGAELPVIGPSEADLAAAGPSQAKSPKSKKEKKNKASKIALAGKKPAEIGNTDEAVDEDNDFEGKICYVMHKDNRKISIFLKTLLDTGSPISFMRVEYIPGGEIDIDKSRKKFCGINNSNLHVVGTIDVDIKFCGKIAENQRLMVVPNFTMIPAVVLGRDILKEFGLRLSTNSIEIAEAAEAIMSIDTVEYTGDRTDRLCMNPDLPTGLQHQLREIFRVDYPASACSVTTRPEMAIELRKHEPFRYPPPMNSWRDEIEMLKIIDVMKIRGIIRPSESAYASRIVFHRNKTGRGRIHVDYRKLNALTEPDEYPQPRIEDQIDFLIGQNFFSLLVLKDDYYQVAMAEDSIKYTAFITSIGHFEFVKMPFGLATARTTFTRWAHDVLSDYLAIGDLIAYMNDYIIATNSAEEHINILESVLERLAENQIHLRIDRCKIMFTCFSHLGYRISRGGVYSEDAIVPIHRYPVPETARGVDRFLGMCAYFRQFINGYRIISNPLHQAIDTIGEFQFGDVQQSAFDDLRLELIQPPIVVTYDPHCDTQLHCTGSTYGFGAMLLQLKEDSMYHPVFYFSKRATAQESKLLPYELKALAIIYAFHKFRSYLENVQFTIITDCDSLSVKLHNKLVSDKLSRWADDFENFDYVFEHRAGTRLRHVEALCRAFNLLAVDDNPFDLDLMAWQERDLQIRSVKVKLLKSPDFQYELRDGLVYRKEDRELLFWVPQDMVPKVLLMYHNEKGHQGVERTWSAIKTFCWFPNRKDRIREYIRDCLKCIVYAPRVDRHDGFVHRIPDRIEPFETLHIGFYNPADEKRLAKHVLVVTDSLTKFTRLYPTKTTSAREVVESLRSYFAHYSRPRAIITNRGAQFVSREYDKFMIDNNVNNVKIATSGKDKSGEAAKWQDGILGPVLNNIASLAFGRCWNRGLADVEYALNNSMCYATGAAASKMLFGINQRNIAVNRALLYDVDIDRTGRRVWDRTRAEAITGPIKPEKKKKRWFGFARKKASKVEIDDSGVAGNFDDGPSTSRV